MIKSSKGSIAIIILLVLAVLTIKGIKVAVPPMIKTETPAVPQWKDDGRNKRSEWRHQPLEYTRTCQMSYVMPTNQ